MTKSFDPSGFDCNHCGYRFPWVASYNEAHHVRTCRDCRRSLPGTLHTKSKRIVKKTSVASNTTIGGWRSRGKWIPE